MIIKLIRENFTRISTISRMYIDGAYECYICEDTDRNLNQLMPLIEIQKIKIKGYTCIPYGTYKINITMSARFHRTLPILLEVPGFEGIRIHPGNTAEDTEGCLLPGTVRGKDFVGESKKAFTALYSKIEKAIADKESVTIIITK